MRARDPREPMVEAGHSLFARGLTHGSTGKLSMRDGGSILVTPTGGSLGSLTEDDISTIDLAGRHVITVDVRQDRLAEFVDGITADAHASFADEPGCLSFDVHRSATEPRRFHFSELYRDKGAFEVEHRATPHYAAWRKIAESCVIPGSQHNTYGEPLLLLRDASETGTRR